MFGAIELGGSKVLCAVGESHEHVVHEARIETRDPETTLAEVIRFFHPHRDHLLALGIASFGPLELNPHAGPSYGSLLRTPKAGWSGAAVHRPLAEALGIRVAIDTDVNAAALAERRWGSARNVDSCVYITVGTGIGVGVVMREEPVHGLMHPELGHLAAPQFCDFVGACPFHGRCFEGVASASALRKRTGRDPSELSDDDPLWELEARYLAALVSACVFSYSPERVVLGGGVLARTGLMERVRALVPDMLGGYVPRMQLSAQGITHYLVAPVFGMRAGLMGAFALAYALASADA